MAPSSTAAAASNGGGTMPMWKMLYNAIWSMGVMQVIYVIVKEAYTIRLHALKEYGLIIHEFDPWFNYRATEYLYEHGWKKFAQWFDYLVWYPLGRPVGTTIYPGMQVTAVFLKNYVMRGMSLNDICCYMPAWFGAAATIMTGLLAYECSIGVVVASSAGKKKKKKKKGNDNVGKSILDTDDRQGEAFGSILNHIPIVSTLYQRVVVPLANVFVSLLTKLTGSTFGLRDPPTHPHDATNFASPAVECGLFAMAIMSIVPAHIMRSVGGGYDNESVAVTAMTLTFYLWTRSLRGGPDNPTAWFYGCSCGLAYFYMVACWGGYVFVLNLVGVHAASLVLLGRYSTKLHRAYTGFYAVGTALATTVPVVGWTPLKSLEQLGPCAVFVGMQLLEYCEVQRRKKKLSRVDTWKLRVKVFAAAACVCGIVVYFLAPTGYFGPISARIRGLFVKHTRTGNPLVDSVAEHQPANAEAYYQYLHNTVHIAPAGFALVALLYFHDSSSFLLVYGVAAYFFSHKMVRLILLTAPIGSALAGVALGRAASWMLRTLVDYKPSFVDLWRAMVYDDVVEAEASSKKGTKGGKKESESSAVKDAKASKLDILKWLITTAVRLVISAYLIKVAIPHAKDFYEVSHQMAVSMSHPTILFKGTTKGGQDVIVDDYREAYWWLRDNTPEDSRIMAWWDYGYQITGIANRTTIADGNTWNHEHIALLGRALTSPEKEGHRIARHLADYVLIWAGGGGDDLAKSPHLARIANSVYRHMCPGDPTCRAFGMTQHGQPSPMMQESLLYKLHSHNHGDVQADRNRFKEVYTSKFGKVRIFKILSVSKESKAWVADPANRDCDVEGGWFCRGRYPPALEKVLKEKKDFAQLEDFNREGGDSDYQKKYFEHMADPDKAKRRAEKRSSNPKPTPEDIERISNNWADTEMTTAMWELISQNNVEGFKNMLRQDPRTAYIRSGDGRGPMWWAHEYKRKEIIKLLKSFGVSETAQDRDGMTPLEV